MGALAPGLASPFRSIQKALPHSAVSASRCRSQSRTLLRQHHSSSTPLIGASAVLTRRSPRHQSGREKCQSSVVAASSAAASFDTFPDDFESVPSTAATDTIETGEVRLAAMLRCFTETPCVRIMLAPTTQGMCSPALSSLAHQALLPSHAPIARRHSGTRPSHRRC